MKKDDASSDMMNVVGSELFTPDGHLTDQAFSLLIAQQLDPLQSLEVSEHLSFCDRCLERYTAILCGDIPVPSPQSSSEIFSNDDPAQLPSKAPPAACPLLEPPAALRKNVMQQIQRKVNLFYFKKTTSVLIAASLALVFWSGGIFSSNQLSNRLTHLIDGLHSSSQTILEHTNEISNSIDDFFTSLQSGWTQWNLFGSSPKSNHNPPQ